jgi:AcrR family transcriptional regulator
MMPERPSPAARREAILQAAATIFAEHGFAAATTDAIARAAGVSKGGLYWHFTSKDAILAALLQSIFDLELALLQTALGAGGPAAERVRQLVDTSMTAVLQLPQVQVIALEFYALAARDTEVRIFLQRYYQRYHALLAELFQQGFAGGEFHRGTPGEAAVALITQLEGLALVWAISPELVPLPEQAQRAAALLLAGLMAPLRGPMPPRPPVPV